MNAHQTIRTLASALLLTLAATAVAPGAQALIEPVECVHDIANMGACAATPTPIPGTPVGGGLVCDYMGGEVGGEVQAGALSQTYCYSANTAPASCGGNPGVGIVENNDDFDQCFDSGACPAPFVGERTTSSINEASHYICVNPTSACGGGGVEFFGQIGSSVPFFGCAPIVYVDQTPCAGLVGREVTIGHPFTGDLVNFCF